MSLLKSRPNAKATPDAVFAACALLEASKPDYRNEDVLSITGGGMSVVAPLVKIYKAHREAIKTCSSLDPAITITLIENLSKRMAALKDHADKAITELMRASEESMRELSAVNKEQGDLIADKDTEIAQLKNMVAELEERLAAEQEANRIARVDVANALAAAEKAERDIAALKTAHDEKLVALADRRSQMLADTLEKQRKTLEAEKSEALAAKDAAHNEQLAAAKSELDNERNARLALSDRLFVCETTLKQTEIEHRAALAAHDEVKAALESQIDDAKTQLKEVRELYQNLVAAVQRENEAQAMKTADSITTVTRTAESFNEKMAEVVGRLDSLIITKSAGDE